MNLTFKKASIDDLDILTETRIAGTDRSREEAYMDRLTELGKTLEPVFRSLCQWGTQYLKELNKE